MPKKKRHPEKPDEQFRRFVEMAQEAGVDERKSEREFKRLTPKKKKKSPPQ